MSCSSAYSDFCDFTEPDDPMHLSLDGGCVTIRCPDCGDIPSFIHAAGHEDLKTVRPILVSVSLDHTVSQVDPA